MARLFGIDKDFWRMPNGFYDQLIPTLELDPYPAYLLLFLCRQIIGHQLFETGVSMRLEHIAQALRMSVPTVRRALATLEELELIAIQREKRGKGEGFPLPLRILLTPPSLWFSACVEG